MAAPTAAPIPTAAPASAAAIDSLAVWDWVPAAPGAAGACCRPDTRCGGTYREPSRDWPDADVSPEGVPVRSTSANSEWVGDEVRLDGGVVLTQGNLKLTADQSTLRRTANQANLQGNVVLRQPGLKIAGTNATVDTRTGLGDLHQARFLDYASGARATADKLSRVDDHTIELEQASFTQCPPDAEDWKLRARHLTLDQETGRGTATHTVLRVGDVPVLYTPYINFPIDDRRQSGFLWPSIGSSSSGLDLAAPYYLNLAPNYDATLTPRHITDRGTMLESEFRYLNQYSNWRMVGSYMGDDRELNDEKRWLVGLQENGQLSQHWSSAIDYTRVSDDDYFDDLSITSLDIRRESHLLQQGQIDYRYEEWSATLLAQQYQTIEQFLGEPYRKLPQLTVSRYGANTNFAFDYSMVAEVTQFDHPDSIDDGGTFVTGRRFYAEPGLSFPMRWAAGFIVPEVRLRHVGYDLDDAVGGGNGEKSPSATVPQGILDAGLFFERELSIGDSGYHQTLEPRLYYLYSEFDDQSDQPIFDTSPLTFAYNQLFSPRRFTGRDRLEDFDQLSVGITSRFIENRSGRELLSASVGQIYYFEDRQITVLQTSSEPQRESNSAVAGQLTYSPTDPVWTNANILWNTDQDQVDEGSFYAHYETPNNALFNVGYRYRRASNEVTTLLNGIEQADFSAVWPLAERWRLFARWNYDLDDGRSLEDLFGVEYSDCCWMLRVIYQRAVDGEELDDLGMAHSNRDSAILVEFQLKGLGSLGRKVDGLLEESIWGYRERD